MTDNKQLAKLEFVSFCIEQYKMVTKSTGRDVEQMFQQNGVAADMPAALNMVYSSSVYANLEQEKTKYWWMGINALYVDLITGLA